MSKLYINTKFRGYYREGTAAVVIADSKKEAVHLLQGALAKEGLNSKVTEEQFEEINATNKAAHVLVTGDY